MKCLAIVGAGGHGREALAVARSAIRAGNAAWADVMLFDDGPIDPDRLERIDATFGGPIDELLSTSHPFVVAIGDPLVRREIAGRIGDVRGASTLIDPSAWLGDDVEFGGGAMVFPGATVTTNVRVGRHSHVNVGCTVSHDCRVGDFVSLSPGVALSGNVTIEDDAFLGTGAMVLPGRRVGQGAVVGAGAVVVEDVAPGATVVGVPAR